MSGGSGTRQAGKAICSQQSNPNSMREPVLKGDKEREREKEEEDQGREGAEGGERLTLALISPRTCSHSHPIRTVRDTLGSMWYLRPTNHQAAKHSDLKFSLSVCPFLYGLFRPPSPGPLTGRACSALRWVARILVLSTACFAGVVHTFNVSTPEPEAGPSL